MGRRFYSKQELRAVEELYASLPTQAIAARLQRTASSVYQVAKKLGLRKDAAYLRRECRIQKGQRISPTTEFKKGQTPANKGLRRPGFAPGRMQETQFKKGQRSGMAAKNWVPVGTILPDSDGYLRIKLREAVYGKEPTGWGNPGVWPQYHRYVWEQKNGPVPKGHVVVFKDGNRKNCTLENLELISRAALAHRNRMWGRLPRELADVIQLNGVLKRKLRESHGKE